ncbi:MAG: diguanylate cyclase [Microbacterium sp. SCN 70-200]|uniref:diguanylate cyclase n=1 Tax=unclassified Microbacterium TaxID=2609290 RepID=UPI00086B1C0E|nr:MULTISPECIES: diguanylate cyclase [unclassified Microbacterium]MBN9214490.1 diguanylate cyclase [Microbacterium sp.]ODT41392.1 MAG: diguanylate cyclase [Microbacterium sp. SCN 70-200]OJV84128.1 MAG: diguanylate cyclase [Microbacterium sp. 70-16]
MTLDEYTAAFMTALVGAVASIAFILETVIRRDTGPGRLWATGYFCGLSATLAYAAWAAGVGGTFAIAVGNVMFVLVPGFVWLGSRQFSDRALRTPAVVVAVGAVATFAAALIDAAQPDGWGGWPVMAASLVVLFIAAAVEALRAPLRLIRSSWAFAAVLLAAALFYAVRLMVFVIAGPESAVFQQWFGPTAANIVTVVLTMVAVIVTSVLRANRTSRQRYAWLTRGGVAADGILLARTFAGAGADIVERASWRSEGIALVVIDIDGIARIRGAFGPEAADDVNSAYRLAVRRYAPASSIVGEDGDGRLVVCAVAATAADARRLAATIYRGCTEELAGAASGLFPFVSVGVAVTEDAGYDVDRLLAGARAAAQRAADTPGASVVLDASRAS